MSGIPKPRRSVLFVPGTRLDRIDKAVAAAPDMVVIDLEDSVPAGKKDEVRADVFAAAARSTGIETAVRINGWATDPGRADLDFISRLIAPPAGLIIPKVRGAGEIADIEQCLGGAGGEIRLHPIIETCAGLENCFAIARASARIDSLLFGGFDLAAELGVKPVWNALLYARGRVVHAAKGAGLDVIDMPFFDLDDDAGLGAEAEAGAEIGFTGKIAIHPKQVAAINDCFSPSADEIAHARRVIAAFDGQDDAVTALDGQVIEEPVLKSMRRVLAIAERLAAAK